MGLGSKHPDTLTPAESSLAGPESRGIRPPPGPCSLSYCPEEQVLGPEHPSTLAARSWLARWTGESGDPAAARDLLAGLLPAEERIFGPEHPRTLTSRQELARWTREAGNPAAARDLYAELLPVLERISGPEHPATLTARATLASSTGRAGDPAAARDLLAELLPVLERVLGPEHPYSLTSRANLAYWADQAERGPGRAQKLASACSLAPGSQVSRGTSGA